MGAADASALAGRAREEFLAEAQEIVAEAERDLARLEGLVARGGRDPATVDALFRSVHTLKGLAGTFGFEGLARLAHALEDALDRLRLDRDALDARAIERLGGAVEHLAALLDHVRAGAADDGARTARIVRELQGAEAAAPGPEPVALDRAVLATLTEYEEHRLRAGLAAGGTLWRARAAAPLDAIAAAIDGLRAAAGALGEVISVAPGDLCDGGIVLAVLVVSSAREEALRAALEGAGRSVERLAGAAPSPRELATVDAGASTRALRTVRVDIGRLDGLMSRVGELSLLRGALLRAAERARVGDTRGLHADLARLQRDFGRSLDGMQRELLDARMVPLGEVLGRVAGEARALSRRRSRELHVVVSGADTAVDKLIVEEVGAPLMHLVRNAIDHGIEAPEARVAMGKPAEGTLAINAWQAGGRVIVEVEDDGAGVDPDGVARRAVARGMLSEASALALDARAAMDLLFRPGFTTRDEATDTSGRGVGLDVVRAVLARLGGVVELASERGAYTRVTLTMPITLAILSVLLVGVRGRRYALPMSAVSEAVRLDRSAVLRVDGRDAIARRGRTLPLCRLDALFGHATLEESRARERLFVVVIALGEQRAAVVVDALDDRHDVVVKPLGPSLAHARWFSGVADLGEQRAGLVLDAVALLDEALGRRRPDAGAP